MLGIEIDYQELDRAVNRIKKQINLECNMLPLIDEDLLRIRRQQEQEQREANERLSREVMEELAVTDMKTHSGLRDLAGSYPDEVSLLTKIGQQFF